MRTIRTLVQELAMAAKPQRVRILAPHEPVEELEVPEGPIVIRAWWNAADNVWEAVEGSHRLAVAARDNLPIIIEPLALHDALPNRNLDGSDVIGTDPAIQAVTVRDALHIFREWGKRPSYRLTAS